MLENNSSETFQELFSKMYYLILCTCRNDVWTPLLREFYCPTDSSTEIFHWVQICPVCYTTMTTRSRGKEIRDKSKGLFEGRGILDQLVSVVEIGAKKLVAFMWLSQSVPHSFLMAFFLSLLNLFSSFWGEAKTLNVPELHKV